MKRSAVFSMLSCSYTFKANHGITQTRVTHDLDFHDITIGQRRNSVRRSGCDQVSGFERHDPADVRDQKRDAECHVGRAAMLPDLPVHAAFDLEAPPINIRRNEIGTDRTKRVEAFSASELNVQFLEIARGHVIERYEAGNGG